MLHLLVWCRCGLLFVVVVGGCCLLIDVGCCLLAVDCAVVDAVVDAVVVRHCCLFVFYLCGLVLSVACVLVCY